MAEKPTSIQDLPDEVLLNIFSHFGAVELCLTISRVCKRWNDLPKILSYTCDSSSNFNHITKVLTAAPELQSLVIDGRKDVVLILKYASRKCLHLRKLFLKRCALAEEDIFEHIVFLYPDLEVLSVQKYYRWGFARYSLISRLKKLSELKLADCQGLDGDTVCRIVDSCQNVKKLSLTCIELFWDDVLIHVINRLGKQLTSLALDGFFLTDVGYSYLNNCSRIQELELMSCVGITDRALLKGIGFLHELTSLRLDGLYNSTAQALSSFLNQPSMSSIVSLNLTECRYLDDEGLKGIAKRCIHLKELRVCDSCNVTDDGISMVIRHCNQLRVLDLSDVIHITGEGWMALMPSHLPHLRELYLLGCCSVRYKYVEELKAAVPELKVSR